MGVRLRTSGLLALAASPLAAPLLAPEHPLSALLVRNFFSALCHQNPARSFWLGGSPAAVCVRCLGIYFGVAIGSMTLPRRTTALPWLTAALLLNGLDVLTGPHDLPLARFLLGGFLGLTVGALMSIPLDTPPALR